MYCYQEMKLKHSKRVCKTLNDPIMFLDKWDLMDLFLCLLIILVFGVLFYHWTLMFILLFIAMTYIPYVKKKNNKGVFIHFAYRHLKVNLLGFINPKGRKKYSD